MTATHRGLVVFAALGFLWRAELVSAIRAVETVGPQPPAVVSPQAPAASADALEWASELPVKLMEPADRRYVADFYTSLAGVLGNDGDRDAPRLDTTEKFRRAHSAALDMAIERAKVGKYPGLDKSLDRAFALAIAGLPAVDAGDAEKVGKALDDGLTPRPITKSIRSRMQDCCVAIAGKLTTAGE